MNWHMHEIGHVGYIYLILLLFVFIIAGYFVVRYTLKQTKKESESAIQILKRRYAQGEISKEEFNEMQKELMDAEE